MLSIVLPLWPLSCMKNSCNISPGHYPCWVRVQFQILTLPPCYLAGSPHHPLNLSTPLSVDTEACLRKVPALDPEFLCLRLTQRPRNELFAVAGRALLFL